MLKATNHKSKSKKNASLQKRSLTTKKTTKKATTTKKVLKVSKSSFSAKSTGTVETAWTSKTDSEIVSAVHDGKVRFFNIERDIGDATRAVAIRRQVVQDQIGNQGVLNKLPYQNYNYDEVLGQCCENVIGHVPIPVGVAGPITIDNKKYYLPMATTEGALIASATRGCKALSEAGGVTTQILRDQMNRGPVLSMPTAKECAEVATWVTENFHVLEKSFNATTNFGKLKSVKPSVFGRNLFLKFSASTGDAMGMNMVGKGTNAALEHLLTIFPNLKLVALSGNTCTDKKPAAINWIEGRGKAVVAEATIPRHVVEKVLKSTPEAMVEVNIAKNLVGSAVAGTMGGNNAHAANMVAAMFIACGQDPAQVVESSNCMTTLELTDKGDLYAAVTMPSLEVGTIGGGTILSAQSASLELLGVKGANRQNAGDNAKQLARVISSSVLAGELSLIAALSSGHLISAHLALNRKPGGASDAKH